MIGVSDGERMIGCLELRVPATLFGACTWRKAKPVDNAHGYMQTFRHADT